jgi:hypothetical protein
LTGAPGEGFPPRRHEQKRDFVPFGEAMELRQKYGTQVISLLLIAACAVFYYLTASFPKETGPVASEYGSAFFPRLLLIFVAVMAAVLLVQSTLRGKWTAADVRIAVDGGRLARGLGLWLLCLGFYLAWQYFGYLYVSPLFMLATGLLLGARSVPMLLFLAAMGPLMYLVFERLLRVGL